MQPGRRFHNGPIWHHNQRLPMNRANIFSPQQRLSFNNNNGINNTQLLMPWFPPNGIIPQSLLSLQITPRRPFASSATHPQSYQQRRPSKRRSEQTDDKVPIKKLNEGNSDSANDEASTLEKYVVPINRGTEKITMAIWDYFLAFQMTEDDLKKKLLLRKSLLLICEDAFPNCRLFMVGSSMTGFATKSSDIDMCFVISDEEIHQKREATQVLTAIAKVLRHCSFVYAPQVIRAKVPILKFKDKASGVECDLNVNNTVGIRNTHLLRYYAYIDWRVRPLMLFIKHWARFHDINDASKQTISSYSLSLMLIHFLQSAVQPPVLPCLQKMKPDLFSKDFDVRRLSLRMEKIDFSSQNTATLGELFLGFLHYYSTVFRYDTDLISIRTGKTLNRFVVERDANQWKNLCIEEPFERSNTARSVYDFYVFQRILRVFSVSFQRLGQQRDCKAILSHPF